jgi:hypothetical protein
MTSGELTRDEAWRLQMRHTRDRVVAIYNTAREDMAKAEKLVADYVLEASGFRAGDLVRHNRCVYRVEGGSGWVNPVRNEPNMVLSVMRVYQGGCEAATRSTLWATGCTRLTDGEADEWLGKS